MALYSMRAVAARTGVNPATLRTWERRYEAVTPDRSPSGTRGYSEETVQRVMLLKRGTDAGHAIRHLAVLDSPALESLLTQAEAQQPASVAHGCLEQLLNAADQTDLAEVERLISTAALSFSPVLLVDELLRPFLEEIGSRWVQGRLSIAQEHAITASVEATLQALVRTYPARSVAEPPFILATLPGERHELPLLMVRYLLASMGAPVLYLGADLPVEDIANAARATGAGVIALSVVHGDDLDRKRESLEKLLSLLPDETDVWIGGRYRRELTAPIPSAALFRIENMAELQHRVYYARGTA